MLAGHVGFHREASSQVTWLDEWVLGRLVMLQRSLDEADLRKDLDVLFSASSVSGKPCQFQRLNEK